MFVATLVGALPGARAGIDTTSFNQVFQFTGEEQSLAIPKGIEEIHVIAIGGEGADVGVAEGGQGSRIEANVAVSPGPLFIEVGGAATGSAGGFNGGASAGTSTNPGGGGGGAADIRTVPRGNSGSVESRLVMAGGGGGAGASGSGGFNGGDGGDGGDPNVSGSGDGAGFGDPHAAGGGGGSGALFDSPGVGGAGGTPDEGSTGEAGDPGTLGLGGQGGDANAGGGAGGGGGGGILGGGGGGGGGLDTHGTTQLPAGGGGGGGGASFAIADAGTITVAAPGTAPSITVSFSAPGTAIDGPSGRVESRRRHKRIVFGLTSSIAIQAFECNLDGAGFAPCEDPFSRRLDVGRHRLLVAAVDPDTDNSDPTPAQGRVRIVAQ